jgi:hypothetical protein
MRAAGGRQGGRRLPYHRDQEHRAGRRNDRVREVVAKAASHRVDVCSCPEFLKGSAIEASCGPTGWSSDRPTSRRPRSCANCAAFLRTDNPVIVMDALGGADQVCFERDAGDAHFVYQRDEDLCEAVGAEMATCGAGWVRTVIGSQFLFPAPATWLVLSRTCGR